MLMLHVCLVMLLSKARKYKQTNSRKKKVGHFYLALVDFTQDLHPIKVVNAMWSSNLNYTEPVPVSPEKTKQN